MNSSYIACPVPDLPVGYSRVWAWDNTDMNALVARYNWGGDNVRYNGGDKCFLKVYYPAESFSPSHTPVGKYLKIRV